MTKENTSITDDDVLNEIKKFFADNDIEYSSLTSDSNLLTDFDLDSLDILELFSSLEETFNVRFPNDTNNYNLFLSVTALTDYIRSFKEA